MKFSTTTEYAIRILTYMAREPEKVFSVKQLHEDLELPYKYTTKLMTILAKKNLINVSRGRNGGFTLKRSTDAITVMQIIEAVEGDEDFNRCVLGFQVCSDESPCVLHKEWRSRIKSLNELLKQTSLTDLKNNKSIQY